MRKEIIKKNYKEKIKLIKKYNQKYYNENLSLIPDSDYDQLKKEISKDKNLYL